TTAAAAAKNLLVILRTPLLRFAPAETLHPRCRHQSLQFGKVCGRGPMAPRATSAKSRQNNYLSSEPRQVLEARMPAMHVHPTEFGAAMQGRKDLAGIEQAFLVERTLESLLLLEIHLGEHGRHQITLLDPDAVLAGQHAAHLDAQFEDLRPERFGPFELT